MSTPQKIEDCFVSVVAILGASYDGSTSYFPDILQLLRVKYSNYELVLIDNGLNNDQLEQLRPLLKEYACIRIVRLSQLENREVAVFAGLESAIGDYVIVMAPEIDPPELIPDLIDTVRSGKDILFGVSKTPIQRGLISTIGARLFYWYSEKFLRINIPLNSTHLIAMNRRAANALTRVRGRYRHVRQLARQVGFSSDLYHYRPKAAGGSTARRTISEDSNLAVEIAITYSRHPLRFVSWLGLIAGMLNLLYAAYALAVYVFNRDVAPGWTTLSLEIALMFFFVFIILTVLAEYVGRTLEEARSQPAYTIMEELVSTVLIADETRRNITK